MYYLGAGYILVLLFILTYCPARFDFEEVLAAIQLPSLNCMVHNSIDDKLIF
jgi:hypothetical protein